MIKERLNQFFKFKNFRPSRVEKELGIGNGLLSKKLGNLGSNVFEKIHEKFPELNMDWVITGRGEMLIDLNILAAAGPIKNEKNKFKLKDPLEMISHELVEVKAMLRVVLMASGESLASQRGEQDSKTVNELSAAVTDEILIAFSEIERKYG